MSNRERKRKARQDARKKPQQSASKAVQPQAPDTSKTNDAKATSVDLSKPSVASNRRFKVKRLFAVATLLCLFGFLLLVIETDSGAGERNEASKREGCRPTRSESGNRRVASNAKIGGNQALG